MVSTHRSGSTTTIGGTAPASLPEIKSTLNRAGETLSDSLQQMRIVADAQINIWMMKISRAVFLAVLGVPLLAAFLALMVYGFVLLNNAFALALEITDMPPWYSPLIRGAIYFGIPAIAMAIIWWKSAGGTPQPRHNR